MRTGFFFIINCAVTISISISLQVFGLPQVFGANTSSSQEFLRETVKDHLARFGYLVPENKSTTSTLTQQKYSIIKFQAINNLEQTGVLDNSTLQLMLTPRCGLRDREDDYSEDSKFVYNRRNKRAPYNEIMSKANSPRRLYKWNKKYITYRVSEYTKQPISPLAIDKDIAKAFKLWEEHVNLKFVRSSRKDSEVDIDIRFVMGDHGDQTPFTGSMAETLGHAYPPGEELGGDIHFNDNFTWSDGTTFLHTATHEIGHALGLHHVMIRNAIMSPYQGDSACPVVLDPDDIRQLQALYGPRPVPLAQRILKPEDDLLSPRLQTTLSEILTTPAPGTKIWTQSTAETEKLSTVSTLPPTTSSSKVSENTSVSILNDTTPESTTTMVTPSENPPIIFTISIDDNSTTTAKVSISPEGNTTSIDSTHDQVSIPHSTPTTATAFPSLVETVLEPTVSTKSPETETTEPTESSPELWTKIMTALISRATSSYVTSGSTATTPIPSTTTKPDLQASGISTEISFAIPPTVFPNDQAGVHFTQHRASSPRKLPSFDSTDQSSSTERTIPTSADNDDRVYFCDSNELCSKKELEENLTEDILALGSGNFELAFDNDSDDESEAVFTPTRNPNPTRATWNHHDNVDENETWRISLKNIKTETESTPMTHPDILLLDETSEMSIPVQNLSSKIPRDQRGVPNENLTKAELTNAAGTQSQHWLTLIDVTIRSVLILFIVLLRPSEYFTLCSYI